MSPYKDKELLNKAKRTKGFIGFPPGYFIIGLALDKNSFENYEDRFYIFYNGTEDYDGDIFKMQYIDVLRGTLNPKGVSCKGGFLKNSKIKKTNLKKGYWHYHLWEPKYNLSKGYELKQTSYAHLNVGKMKAYKNVGIDFHLNTFKWYNNIIRWFIGSWKAGDYMTNEKVKFINYMKVFLIRKKNCKQLRISYCLLNKF